MRRYCALLLSILCVGIFAFQAYAASDVPKEVLESCDSVVRIETIYDDGFGTGSGFVVAADDEQTLILTNHHVAVEGNPNDIYVLLNDEADIPASVIASDKNKDLALLKVSYPLGMKPIKLSENGAEKGEAIYVIGFPGAADKLSTDVATTHDDSTITDGIVSAIRELDINSSGKSAEVLQLNAAINPGNSGGPVVNKKGEAVGVSTYTVEGSQGVYGAISVDEVKAFLDENGIVYEMQQSNVIVFIIAGVVLIGIIVLIIVLISKKKHKASESSTEWTFVNNENTENVKKTQKKSSGSAGKIIAIVACSLVVLAIAGYFVTLSLSHKAADEHRFADAYELLIAKKITGITDGEYLEYLVAGANMENGHFDVASKQFSKLNGYRDSYDMAIECKYQKGLSLFEGKAFDQAKEIFLQLSTSENYKDSKELATDCDYQEDLQNAISLLEDGKYFDARKEFYKIRKIDKYTEIADEYIHECDYRIALDYVDKGKYTDAYRLFHELGNYKDSNDRWMESVYLQAMKYKNNSSLEKAAEEFEKLVEFDYGDSKEQADECNTLAAIELLENQKSIESRVRAYALIEKAANNGYEPALENIDTIKDFIYNEAVQKYQSCVDYKISKPVDEWIKKRVIADTLRLFSLIKDYKDAEQYIDKLEDAEKQIKI